METVYSKGEERLHAETCVVTQVSVQGAHTHLSYA